MPLTIASSADQPVITFDLARDYGEAPTIAGSPGWCREKRVGYPETPPGGSQWQDAPVDLEGSTYFSYPGVPAIDAWVGNAGDYAQPPLKPGGDSQYAYWPLNVEFVTSSPEVEFRLLAPAASIEPGRILVNGFPISDEQTEVTTPAGNEYTMRLTFPAPAQRTITVIALDAIPGRFGGAAVASGYTITKSEVQPRVAIIGDSYTNGAGDVFIQDTFAWRLADAIGGGRAPILAGIGGTGPTATINSQPESAYSGRVAAVMALAPSTVIVSGGATRRPRPDSRLPSRHSWTRSAAASPGT
ncbi:hypothetical protein GCM10025865_01380 [Paraoerskovia sediminicola]|uniref:SGNH hydrolase-type esterase domain-containing protein n=1 Tax=Paraoerskovia sediminicola TaxID=1138587 RepID=A0ABN6X8C9_9CELL|nr:SGNH/GDSL hydrolase family protein [Paraoerskovia sediminicola]BDZ40839.1 hypothetical protein GCM10025865_01380 [Paraoerskovia sediminicola]